MYRYALAVAALMLTIAAVSSVRAEEARVSYPFMAGSLHAGGVDMVYYIDPSEEVIADPRAAYDVYATFAAPGQPVRHKMTLTDGAEAEIAHQGAVYRFYRAAHRVYATVEPTALAAAQ